MLAQTSLVKTVLSGRPSTDRVALKNRHFKVPCSLSLDAVVISPEASLYRFSRGEFRRGRALPLMRAGDLPALFTESHQGRHFQASNRTEPGKGTTARRPDERSIRERLAQQARQMASNVGKAISGFSKALKFLPKHKADKLRGIIAALRGFNSLVDAIASGSVQAAISSARNIGASLKEVAKYSRKASGLRWGFRRAGAFIPILGTVVEGEASRRAILRSERAARAGNEAASAIWGGAAALHLLSSTLSGCVDLLLLLSVGTAGPGYAVLNGVVSGLGAVADIAGELAE